MSYDTILFLFYTNLYLLFLRRKKSKTLTKNLTKLTKYAILRR